MWLLRAHREMEDITFWLSTVSKGLNPYDEEAKLKPGLYKCAAQKIHGISRTLTLDCFSGLPSCAACVALRCSFDAARLAFVHPTGTRPTARSGTSTRTTSTALSW